MEDITYFNFEEYEKDSYIFLQKIKNTIKSDIGFCIIKNFPVQADDETLINFSNELGTVINEKHNINGGCVYRVEFNDNMETPAYANTHYRFPCHTDCSDFLEPPDTILLLCEKQSEKGGESFFIKLDEILKHFSEAEKDLLRQPVYLIGTNFLPILTSENGKDKIRYNRITIELYSKVNNVTIPPEHLKVIDKLDEVMDKYLGFVKIFPNECLIVNNQTILHGRSSFDKESGRLLKRVRFTLR